MMKGAAAAAGMRKRETRNEKRRCQRHRRTQHTPEPCARWKHRRRCCRFDERPLRPLNHALAYSLTLQRETAQSWNCPSLVRSVASRVLKYEPSTVIIALPLRSCWKCSATRAGDMECWSACHHNNKSSLPASCRCRGTALSSALVTAVYINNNAAASHLYVRAKHHCVCVYSMPPCLHVSVCRHKASIK